MHRLDGNPEIKNVAFYERYFFYQIPLDVFEQAVLDKIDVFGNMSQLPFGEIQQFFGQPVENESARFFKDLFFE